MPKPETDSLDCSRAVAARLVAVSGLRVCCRASTTWSIAERWRGGQRKVRSSGAVRWVKEVELRGSSAADGGCSAGRAARVQGREVWWWRNCKHKGDVPAGPTSLRSETFSSTKPEPDLSLRNVRLLLPLDVVVTWE